jgi:transcriptional regulator with XRE-family HTH domain
MVDFAERIDWLFKEFTNPQGREYTYQEVEAGTGKAVTSTYVWKLRTGKATNPGYRVLKAISLFFQVPISYFFEEELSPDYVKELHLATKLHQAGVAHIALRASDLDVRGKQAVLEMIEYVRKAQGLTSALNGDETHQPQ